MAALFFAGTGYVVSIVYKSSAAHRFGKASQDDGGQEIVRISAASLGRELRDHSSSFQSRYYMRRIIITGTVTGAEIMHTTGSNGTRARRRDSL